MKKVTIIFFLLFLIILTGCNGVKSNDQKVTEEKAKQMIIDERSRECCDDAEIISIISEPNKYIIQWEIDSIAEKGTDSIHKKTGNIKRIESSRGICKFK